MNMRFLVLYPAAFDHAAMDTIVYRMIIFAVPFIFPAIVISIDEMGTDEIFKGSEFFVLILFKFAIIFPPFSSYMSLLTHI